MESEKIYAPGIYAFDIKKGNKLVYDFYQLEATSVVSAKKKLDNIFPGCTFILRQIGNRFHKDNLKQINLWEV